jgi:DNA-binding NtrC family response regulator
MMEYDWPGNVRELQNAVQFAIVRSNDRIITKDDLPIELRSLDARTVQRRGTHRKLDEAIVKEALVRSGGNKAKAARLLEVGRATLYRFLKDYPEVISGP